MSAEVVKYAFVAGELSPTLYGRGDLTKFDLGMAEAYNFFVDYRGGLSSRPGFEFIDHVKEDSQDTRFAEFIFSPDIENTYVILFGHNYVRMLQDGGYVLEDSVAASVSTATPAVVTAAGHGLSSGRWVKISNRTFEVRNPATDTFELYSVPDAEPFNGTGFTGSSFRAVYEIVSPYPASVLADLSFDQYRDSLRITHPEYPIYDLVRSGHTSWAITEAEISPYYEGPTPSSYSSSTPTGDPVPPSDAQTIFAITSVYEDGTESSIGTPYLITGVVNYTVTAGSVSVSWPIDPDAVEYKVYRSIISVQEDLSLGSELGYIGRTKGTKFTDPNIAPDFGQTSQNNYNPFAPGAITSIRVTAGGSGYAHTSAITVTGGGSGFDGQIVVDDSGAIVNVIIKSGGTGYVNPTVSFGSGTGAAADIEARPTTGTYPALSAIFQQRQIFAASESRPITIWGSQYKRFNNFGSSDFAIDSDAFEFDLDTAAIAPIRHMLVTRGGLLAMTQNNVWLLNGGGTNNPITPTNALADPQTYTGVSPLRPIPIDSDILYVEGKGYAVRMLSYNEVSRVYSGEDRSVLSNHLFGADKEIIRWGYQESPFKTVWCVRSDGYLLAFTIVKSEEVFAWTPCATRGKFLDLVSVHELVQDRVYVMTQRMVRGRRTKFIERMDLRQFMNVEDAWCVDAGLSLNGTEQAVGLTIYHSGDEYYALADAAHFILLDEGKVLRAGNGIFRLAAFTSSTRVELEELSPPTNWIPETDESQTFYMEAGSWTLDSPVTTLSGLWHLEGETVSILADGNVFKGYVVQDGAVTLPVGVTRAIVGIPFTCRAKTLPLVVPDAAIEGKRKRIVGLAVRLTRSRGLQYGDAYDRTYAMRERTTEAWGRPTRLQEGIRYQHIGTTWDEEGHTYFKLEDPVPVTLLSFVSDIEVGDESD